MNFEQGIQTLKDRGLNIFLSARVIDLPENIFTFTDDQKKKTLILIGNGGKTLWEKIPDFSVQNPIDDFSISQMKWFGENILKSDIEILFPDDNQLIPLQQLGRFFNLSHQSPLGIDISNEFGLWFAFRGIMLTDKTIPLKIKPVSTFPCESCIDKLCLTTTEINDARLKCPIKIVHQYKSEQRNYHQKVLSNLKMR
ncbi:MAG: hypothetical protein H7177_12900 [Rhizobacter sp.]|nr:hypothetical protein [Bacteriovorax sp.]